jgi:o-succinylbenzoate synthase
MAERLRLDLRLTEFELPAPLQTARARWQRRRVLELRLVGAGRVVGRGEAAPLPGYSPDELEAVQGALDALELCAPPESASVLDLVEQVERLLPGELPSARFALQTALLDHLAQATQRPLWSLLQELVGRGAPADASPLSGLLASSEPAQAIAEAERQHAQGVRCFKLKIGPGRLQPRQRDLLAALRARWGHGVTLRLDANGSLAVEELAATAVELARFEPELVEEPLANPSRELLAALPFDWALDESLQSLPEESVVALLRLPRCRALVLKLTTLGGFGAAAALAKRARAAGKLAIVSHALDGPIAWLASAHFALAIGSKAAAGLWPRADGAGSPLFAEGRLLPPRAAGLGGEQ